MAAERKPLVFEQGEIIEQRAGDSLNLNEGIVTTSSNQAPTVKRKLTDIFGDIVNVKDYGAKGDGVTDDTQAFVNAASKGGVVYVPHGRYLVNQNVSGEFISFGHPTFDGTGKTYMEKVCTDLYNDYVHKNQDYPASNEGIYGDKTAYGKWNFNDDVTFKGNVNLGSNGGNNGKTITVNNPTVFKESVSFAGLSDADKANLLNDLIAGGDADGFKVTSGKLKVSPTELAGNGLVGNDTTGKLAVKAKANGGITVDSNGIAVDPSGLAGNLISGGNADGLALDSNGLIKVNPNEFAGAGLKYNSTTGKLTVDFSGTSAEVKKQLKALMKSLRLPIWLEGNTDFYVNGNSGSDETGDGTQENPWATIQYAATTIATDYNLGDYIAYVHVTPKANNAAYAETLSLGSQTRTTGRIYFASTSRTQKVLVEHKVGTSELVKQVDGTWAFENFYFHAICDPNTSGYNNYPEIFNVSGGTLQLFRCDYEYTDNTLTTDAKTTSLTGFLATDGGRIYFSNTNIKPSPYTFSASNKVNTVSLLKGQIAHSSNSQFTMTWFSATNDGLIRFNNTARDLTINGASSDWFNNNHSIFTVEHNFTLFFEVDSAKITRAGAQPYWDISATGISGTKYSVSNGGALNSLKNIAPGDTAGTPAVSDALEGGFVS